MTNEEFKAWREAKGLSQQDAADLLGASSRFVVMRWEAGAEMPTTIAARIIEAEAVLTSTKPGEKPRRNKHPLKTKGLPTRVILTPRGKRVPPEWTRDTKLGQVYWQYDWIDPNNGHHMFNLYRMDRDHDEQIRGLCTPIRLDANTWTARADFQLDEPAVLRVVDQMNALLAPTRDSRPQTLEATIAPNPQQNDAQSTAGTHGENKFNFFA